MLDRVNRLSAVGVGLNKVKRMPDWEVFQNADLFSMESSLNQHFS